MANRTQGMTINMSFTADTKKARAELESLKSSLNKLTASAGKDSPLGLTKELNSAVSQVNKLQSILKSATSSSTGNLDLSKFQRGMRDAQLNVESVKKSLMTLGPEGTAAFNSLTKSIVNAEVPLKRTSNLMSGFMHQLKETAKWQISNSMFRSFMSGIQGAYQYSQDLNESLNNIRIVTGQNVDQMAAFAKQANNAAKALSTTTTEYTDAALIFYQQGLKDDAVTERTNATIKMANVTGESAKEVSSYMTAIWNNFDDGTKSLESYADTITALGAATASSSAEIAEGLEKFAAIGNTVGLSYEYATSALATVVAQTRQSADTVGTAFKTLFARIQDLELGETLDDGTTLGKYSQALQTIGVNVKKANGEVKAMDDILNEMGSKWNNISEDTQIAVAQAVAGTRQYSQLMALMENWDTFKVNLEVAENSEGKLEEQQKIYEQSWEAANKRVRASMEEIYSSLAKDDFFINLANGLTKIIKGVKNLIDALGGVQGVVSLISTTVFRFYEKDIADSIDSKILNIRTSLGLTAKEAINFKQQWISAIQSLNGISEIEKTVYTTQSSLQTSLMQAEDAITRSGGTISDLDKNILQMQLDINAAKGEELIKARQLYEEEQAILATKKEEYELSLKGLTGAELVDKRTSLLTSQRKIGEQITELNEKRDASQDSSERSRIQQEIAGLNERFKQLGDLINKYNDVIDAIEERTRDTESERLSENKIKQDNSLKTKEAEYDKAKQKYDEKYDPKKAYFDLDNDQKDLIKEQLKKRSRVTGDDKKASDEEFIKNNPKLKDAYDSLSSRGSQKITLNTLEKLESEYETAFKNLTEATKTLGEERENAAKVNQEYEDNRYERISGASTFTEEEAKQKSEQATKQFSAFSVATEYLEGSEVGSANAEQMLTIHEGLTQLKEDYREIAEVETEVNGETISLNKAFEEYKNVASDANASDEQREKAAQQLFETIESLRGAFSELYEAELEGIEIPAGEKAEEVKKAFNDTAKAAGDASAAMIKEGKAALSFGESTNHAKNLIAGLKTETASFGQVMAASARAVSATSMMFNSLNGITSTLEDTTKSAGETILSVFGSLSMMLPMVLSSYSKLGTTVKASALWQLVFEANTRKAIAAEVADLGIKKKEISAEEKDTAIKAIKLKLSKKGIKATDEQIAKEIESTIVTKASTKANKENAKSELIKAAAKNAVLLAIVATAVAITTIALVAWKKEKKAREQAAEAAQKQSDKLKEEREALEETAEKVEELASKYKDLTDSYKDQTIGLEELRQSTYNLLLEYGLQEDAVKALGASYEELGNIIENTSAAQDKAVIDKVDEEMKQSQRTVKSKITNKLGFTQSEQNGNYIDISGFGYMGKLFGFEGQDLKKELKNKFGFKFEGLGGDQMSVQELTDVLLSDQRSAFLDVLNGSKSEAAHEILELVNEVQDQINAYDEAKESGQKYAASYNAKDLLDKSDIQNYGDYEDIVDKVTNNILKYYSNEGEARTAAQQALNESIQEKPEFSKYSKISNIADVLKNKGFDDNKISSISNELDALSESDIETFANKLDYFVTQTSSSVSDFMKTDFMTSTTDLENKINKVDKLSTLLKNSAEDAKITREQVEDLYSDEKLDLGVSEDEFMMLDYASQQYLLMQQMADAQIELNKGKEEAVRLAEEELNTYKKANSIEQTGYNNTLNDAKERVTYFKDNLETIIPNKALRPDIENFDLDSFLENVKSEVSKYNLEDTELKEYLSGENVTTDSGKEIIASKDLEKSYNAFKFIFGEDGLEDILNAKEGIENYTDAVAVLEENLKKAEESGVSIFEQLTSQMEDVDKHIDNMQSAYSTMYSAIEDYNKNGFLTLDSMQALLDLSPEYLKYLKLTENGYKLDKQSVVDYHKSLIALQAVEDAQALQETVRSAIQEGKITDDLKALAATTDLTEANWDLVASEMAVVSQMIAEGKAAGTLKGELLSAVESAYEFVNKRNQIREDTANSLSVGTLDKMSGVGSSSSSSAEDPKVYEDEFDRFYELKESIDDLTDAMKKLEKQQQHLAGASLAESIQEENGLLNEQIGYYNELLEGQLQYAKEVRGQLSNYGITFDTQGNITNYDEITQKMMAEQNSVIAAKNAGTISDEAADKATKNYEHFKDLISKYDTIENDIETTNSNLQEALNKQIENSLKAHEVMVKLKLDTSEAKRDLVDFKRMMNEDIDDWTSRFENFGASMSDAFKKAKTYTGKNGTLATNTSEINRAEEFISKAKGLELKKKQQGGKLSEEDTKTLNGLYKEYGFGSTSEAEQKIKDDYLPALMKNAEEFEKTVEDTVKSFNSAIDQSIDKINEAYEGFKDINSELSHQSKLTELLYGSKAYDTLDHIAAAQEKNMKSQMASLKSQSEFYEEQYNRAVKKYGADSTVAEKWKNAWKNAIDELHSTEEAYIESIMERYENSVNKIFDNLEKKLTKNSSISFLKEQWDADKEAAEDYYDTIERIYQVEKLEHEWQESIDTAATVKGQQKLKSIMDAQTKALKNKTKLSKYDVELAQKRLEVAKAQIALEEAQNNKNSTKLVRGTDGNWSYQYTANTEDVEKKQQELLDKANEAYETAKSKVSSARDSLLSAASEELNKLKSLELQLGAAGTAEEKKQIEKQIAYWKKYYNERMPELAESLKQAQIDLRDETSASLLGYNNEDLSNYGSMTGEEQKLVDALKNGKIDSALEMYETSYAFLGKEQDAYSSVYANIQATAEGVSQAVGDAMTGAAAKVIDSWANEETGVQKKVTSALKACQEEVTNLETRIDEGTKAAGEDFTDVDGKVGELENSIKDVQKAVKAAMQEAKKQLPELEKTLDAIVNEWKKVKEPVQETVNAAQAFVNALNNSTFSAEPILTQLGQVAAAAYEAASAVDSINSGGGTKTGDDKTKTGTEDTKNKLEAYTFSSDRGNLKSKEIDGSSTNIITSTAKKIKDDAKTVTIDGKEYYMVNSNYKGDYMYVLKEDKELYNKRYDEELAARRAATIKKVKSTVSSAVDKAINYVKDNLSKELDFDEWFKENRLSYGAKVNRITVVNGKESSEDLKTLKKHNKTLPKVKGEEASPSNTRDYYRVLNAYANYLRKFESYDTGGYTGDWAGSSGKLAVLHSKEIVLNKKDTSNILSAVTAIRDMQKLNSSFSNLVADKVAATAASLSKKTTGVKYSKNKTNKTNNQNNVFNITAEFPAANDVSTIKEALLSLPTIANQYLSNKYKN